MGSLLGKLAVKLLKAKWGAILPAIFKAAAEGQLGSGVKWIYWRCAGYKTITGAVLMGIGAGLETVAASHPEWTWAVPAARWVYIAGGVLSSVGLVDGGTRAPWPDGTPKELPTK